MCLSRVARRIEFLHSLNIPGASNKLEDCLRILFRSNEMTAVLRVCTLFQIIFSDPMRWLAGKHEELKDFSIVSCSRMLELAEEMFQAIAADGHALLDPPLLGVCSVQRMLNCKGTFAKRCESHLC